MQVGRALFPGMDDYAVDSAVELRSLRGAVD